MAIDYQNMIRENNVTSLDELTLLFDGKISDQWVKEYDAQGFSNKTSDVTIQTFFKYTFIYDFTGDPALQGIDGCSIPDSRVIGVFGISTGEINLGNRAMMRKYVGLASKAYSCFGGDFDKGHFIAHYSGGPIDINLFPHRRDINRGWSREGKRYREMENFVGKNPGVFVFSRPVYKDFSCCPYSLEYGYCDKDLNFTVEQFSNRYM